MKRIPSSACLRRTLLTTSTTGPQVLLVQYLGVAKTTTNGDFAASASATELSYSLRSGFVEVDSCSSVDVRSVGVFEGTAGAPTSGAAVFSFTTTFPTAWIFRPPTGSARSQYVPGSSSSRLATKIASASPGSLPETPIGSDRAVVRANGTESSPRASHTFAVGRETMRLCS